MPIDWLTLWGVTQAAGFLFKPVLESLAEDAVKDIAKDKIKESFGSVFKAVGEDTLTKAYGKAVKELLQLIQDELIANDIAEAQVEAWNDDVKLFIRSQGVQQTLRRAFSESSSPVDAGLLAQSWQRMPNGPHPLPAEFNWPRIAKLFSLKVRNIREEEKELRDLLTAQASAETAEAIQNQTGVAPDFDLEKYREALLETYQHLKLELLDHTGSAYKIQLRSVFVPQTVRDCQEYIPQVFEIPKEHLLRLRKAGGLDEAMLDLAEGMREELIDTRRRSYLDQSPRSVLELVRDDRLPRLVILGSPGSGKSTLLKALALEWAQESNATERAARPVPLFIELREYDRWDCPNGKSFIRFLHEAQIACRLNQGRLDEVLRRRGGAVLLLDGLDEIFDQNRRNDALNDIHRFSNEYPDTPVIVTSRIIGYQQRRLSDAGFRHFMLQDLEDAQIEKFLDRWHQTFVAEARERDAKRRRLAEAISDSRAIRELADNPLLLTMMSILNLHQELPRDRVQLYEQASRVLLHQWDVERLGLKVTIDYKEKAEMLRRLALEMQSAPGGLKGNIIAGDKLEALFRDYFKQELEHPDPRNAAREMMRQLRERNGILCLLGQDNFSFVHRTFLEYFCASAIVQQFHQKLSLDYLKEDVFGRHWSDETWHEVLYLIAGIIAISSSQHIAAIVEYLSSISPTMSYYRHIFLAAECFQLIPNSRIFTSTRDMLSAVLQKLARMGSDSITITYDDYEIGNGVTEKAVRYLVSLGFLSDPRKWLLEQILLEHDEDTYEPPTDDIFPAIAIRELARGWKNDPNVLALLKYIVKEDKFGEWTHQAAMHEMVVGWNDDPETLFLLKDILQNSINTDDIIVLLTDLADYWRADRETFLLLKQFSDCDDVEYSDKVRMTSIQKLFQYWKDDFDMLPFLKDRAVNDPSPDANQRQEWGSVRDTAIEIIARGWPDDPGTLPLLRERAENDPTPWLREKAKRLADEIEARG